MLKHLTRATVATAVLVLAGMMQAAAEPTDPNEPPTSTGPGGVWPKTVQGDIHRQFATAGAHSVTVSQQLYPCDDLFSAMEKTTFWLLGANDLDKWRCTDAFPHGTNSPIGMLYYYPADIQDIASAPVLVWLPGFTGDAGQYNEIAELWASRGFVVAMPYNFVNSFPTDQLWGIQALLTEEARADSPLHGHLDFAHTILGGHSGGAGATFWGASYLPANAHLLDPRLHIIGAVSVGTGIQAPTGLAVTVPMLSITGNLDLLTPDMLWPRWIDHQTIFQAPAYIATAINATHFAAMADIPNNPVAGLAMAWLEHLVGDHADADAVFIGPNWRLPLDNAFTAVARNTAADALR